MYLALLALLAFIFSALAITVSQFDSHQRDGECRFAKDYSTQDIIANKTLLNDFLRKVVRWESNFINKVGTDPATGMTFDGSRIDVATGQLLAGGLHEFTAASKESIHLGIIARVLQEAEFTEEVFSGLSAFKLVEQKVNTLQTFYRKYPGFGGYLPWVYVKEGVLEPTYDFVNRVPALDNAEMFWGALALSVTWRDLYPNILPQLRSRWDQVTWKPMIKNARKIFFNETTKKIRAVADIANMSLPVSQNKYTNKDDYYLDDPYEGELYTWIITLFAKDQFTPEQINFIWADKRKKLQSAEYPIKSLNKLVTVEKGFWFSAHEQWKNLFMPYYLSPTYKRVSYNNQKARIWNSIEKKIPGLFASMAGPAENNVEDTGYFSASGVPEISFNAVTFDKLVTPYGAYPLLLINKEYGAAWLHNMLYSPCGQTKYGALEGTGLNGSLMSPTLTWDTKITTVLAILNGTRSIIENYLEKEGLLKDFVDRLETQYSRLFSTLKGEDVPFALPSVTISSGRPDFTTCQ